LRRRFVTLDVFTDRRFAGNPLAVVRDSAGLDTAAMQTIAREFNLPETVFVFPPADAGHTAKLRIFTPANELPFAGHPTVGAAVLLGHGEPGQAARQIVLEEEIGPVRCTVRTLDRARGHAQFALPRLPTQAGTPLDADAAARALGLSPDDIDRSQGGVARWSAGVEFTFVPLRGLDAMARARPDAAFEATIGNNGPGRAYLFCKETAEPGHDYHARMFAPGMGIPEDPATGSAVAAFAGIVAADRADGDHTLRIEQGYEMKRPSLIELGLTVQDGVLTAASIGGGAVMVAEGSIET
jgi:trans-2,3-dihydro-3-hydroxyanthranilate isomerase